MCSMSLTVVVNMRWYCVTMRPAIWSRRQAGIVPDHRDHGNADFRKDVDRRAPGRERADDQKQQGKHDERVGAPQSDADELSHFRCRLPSSRAMVELALLRHGPPTYAAPAARIP